MTFDVWWDRYPLKVGKADALKAWGQLAPGEALCVVLMAALERQIAWRARCAARREWVPPWPHPATWIRKRRFEDEIPGLEPRAASVPIPKPERPSASIYAGPAPEPVKKPYPTGEVLTDAQRADLLAQMQATMRKVIGRGM